MSGRRARQHGAVSVPPIDGYILEGDLDQRAGLFVDGSAELLEGIVDDEELAELRAYAIEQAHRRHAAAASATPTQPGSSRRTPSMRKS